VRRFQVRRLYDASTGDLAYEWPDLPTGTADSSIVWDKAFSGPARIAKDERNNRFAITDGQSISVITWTEITPPKVSPAPREEGVVIGWVALQHEPEEMAEPEHEIAAARVAVVDVAQVSGVLGTRVPRADAPGRFATRVHPVDATTNVARLRHPGG